MCTDRPLIPSVLIQHDPDADRGDCARCGSRAEWWRRSRPRRPASDDVIESQPQVSAPDSRYPYSDRRAASVPRYSTMCRRLVGTSRKSTCAPGTCPSRSQVTPGVQGNQLALRGRHQRSNRVIAIRASHVAAPGLPSALRQPATGGRRHGGQAVTVDAPPPWAALPGRRARRGRMIEQIRNGYAERARDGVQRAHRRQALAGLDLRDQAGRHPDVAGQAAHGRPRRSRSARIRAPIGGSSARLIGPPHRSPSTSSRAPVVAVRSPCVKRHLAVTARRR